MYDFDLDTVGLDYEIEKLCELADQEVEEEEQRQKAVAAIKKGVFPTRQDALGEEISVGSLVLYHNTINSTDSRLLFGVVVGVPYNEKALYVDVLGLESRRRIVPRRYSALLKSNVGQLVSSKIRQARKIKDDNMLYSEWLKYWKVKNDIANTAIGQRFNVYTGMSEDVGKYA